MVLPSCIRAISGTKRCNGLGCFQNSGSSGSSSLKITRKHESPARTQPLRGGGGAGGYASRPQRAWVPHNARLGLGERASGNCWGQLEHSITNASVAGTCWHWCRARFVVPKKRCNPKLKPHGHLQHSSKLTFLGDLLAARILLMGSGSG